MSRARKTAVAPNAAGGEALVCMPRMLPRRQWVAAARNAVEINPVNHPPIERLGLVQRGLVITHERIAVLTTKYWRAGSVKLTVGFLDNPSTFLRRRILSHMNAWAKTANVSFVQSSSEPQVRIARALGGYWSYVGTDILSIAADQPTMNLQGFTLLTPESEFRRVVRHETGHTMGFPHEHMRRELVDLIDPAKAIKFYGRTQGWDPDMVRRQVLTPIEESSLLGTAHTDTQSIMCYQIPGTLTKDGKPIVGGLDIDATDYDFAGKIYPKAKAGASAGAPRAAKRRRKAKAVSRRR
jgi:hypothetical protein